MPIYTFDQVKEILEGRKTILNIGPAFSGKTYSLWTLIAYLKEHNLGKLHYFDLDHKVESLITALTEEPDAKRLNIKDHIVVRRLKARPRIATKDASKITASKDLFEDFKTQINDYENQIDVTTGEWKQGFDCGAVIIDSLTRYNEIVQEFVIAELGRDIGSVETDARSDYTMIMNKVKQAVTGMKILPCVIGWMAHDQIVKNEVDGRVILIPSCAGKGTLAPNLPQMFNVVVVSTTQEETIPGQGKRPKYVWQVQPGGWVRSAGVTSKTGRTMPQFIDQDYRKIL